MDKETEKYYDDRADMFLTQGWKDFIEDRRVQALRINSVEQTKDVNDLFFRKGQLSILAEILNLESAMNHVQEDSSDVDNL
tara:strand:+ start:2023 stop:2265 length:243 start_codon:yes stop_codon:yes gene_type:complete